MHPPPQTRHPRSKDQDNDVGVESHESNMGFIAGGPVHTYISIYMYMYT